MCDVFQLLNMHNITIGFSYCSCSSHFFLFFFYSYMMPIIDSDVIHTCWKKKKSFVLIHLQKLLEMLDWILFKEPLHVLYIKENPIVRIQLLKLLPFDSLVCSRVNLIINSPLVLFYHWGKNCKDSLVISDLLTSDDMACYALFGQPLYFLLFLKVLEQYQYLWLF